MVPMKLRQERSRRQHGKIDPGLGDKVAREKDAAGDGVQGQQQHDERHVLLGGVAYQQQALVAEAADQIDHCGHAEH